MGPNDWSLKPCWRCHPDARRRHRQETGPRDRRVGPSRSHEEARDLSRSLRPGRGVLGSGAVRSDLASSLRGESTGISGLGVDCRILPVLTLSISVKIARTIRYVRHRLTAKRRVPHSPQASRCMGGISSRGSSSGSDEPSWPYLFASPNPMYLWGVAATQCISAPQWASGGRAVPHSCRDSERLRSAEANRGRVFTYPVPSVHIEICPRIEV